ncbi:LacI family DNA-binding transcriptional regulator [Bacillus sp. AFS055030]|uniref:LacI family DNA-binding transcriptional regulator n=1 Tax=Bacillus sp. AFS055030 TaxID=2033507 RepID=UPI000BFD4654|nr:LacI family DNA-binding transcriptional regulator [Bacillus sp. AFS055030]PGL71799.1 LacI family transcriptional regulator [Bacillus sp. AFS055030]
MSNIKEIARIAGVSVTTVSRVLNDEPYVSEEKRKAVLNAIEQTNYQRNQNAVNLSKGKTNLIGVVIPFSHHPYFGLLIDGIANEAIKNNYKLVLFQSNYEEKREIEALEMLQHKQIDSLIICSRICSIEMIEAYKQYGQIILFEDTRNTGISSTFIDHYNSFMIALEYLYKKGHRKIGYCIGRRTGMNSKQRETAYIDFHKKYNESIISDFVFDNCYYFEDGERVVQSLLNLKERPTALLVTSDQVAAGVQTCCNEHGIVIPRDLAIIGFDNQPIAKVMKLTTVEIPLREVGKKLFIQAINSDVTQEEIAFKLIERQTV